MNISNIDYQQFNNCLKANLGVFCRPLDSHKGVFGQAAIIGGADGMQGAAILAARAALYLGAGRVYLASLAGFKLDINQPEIMSLPIGRLGSIVKNMHQAAILCGCGMGQDLLAKDILQQMIKMPLPVVFDADALNLLAINQKLGYKLAKRQSASFLTPHPLEAARLLNQPIDYILQNRLQAAQQLATKYFAYVVLKGYKSIVVAPDAQVLINQSGNPGLATAGSGDVLGGILVALLAQGVESFAALQIAVFLHGLAAERLVEQGSGVIGMTASEIIFSARQCLNQAVRNLP